ncbi:MAG TPA: BTAD domain-containing putative transcriptional regulator, partial [Gemmatimonadaceae bacterium]|nr:BTAD domain-containing putative transcriptional regulator [Gemmatimonadaceae bacterium]
MTLRLRTFGGVYLSRDGTLLTGAAGQRRLLALLTVIATAGERGISRDKVLALLWSDGEPDKSRHALTQALYHTRKALRAEQIFLNSGDLRLNPDVISSDVLDMQRAVDEGRLEDAAELYAGPFLDGFYLNSDAGFEFWVASERDRLARQHSALLVTLAARATAARDGTAERRWRERQINHDPLDSASVARLMTCLAAAGDRAAALQVARTYETRIRAELDLPADRAVTNLVAEIRRAMQQSVQQSVQQNVQQSVQQSVQQGAQNAQRETRAGSQPKVIDDAVGVSRSATPMDADEPTQTSVIPCPPPPVEQPTSPALSLPAEAVQAIAGSRSTTDRSRSTWWIAATIAAASIAVVTAVRIAVSHFAGDRAAQEASTIMVAPFQVTGTDPSATYLSEGLVDLLTTRIADADSKRAADPAHVLEAWKRAGYPNDSAASVTAASRVARGIGAGEVVVGSVAQSPTGLVVHASLVDVAQQRIKAQADVPGSPDSLIGLADRIINSLILTELGEHVGGAQPAAVSHLALRAYLVGRVAYRRGDYYGAMRSYSRALVEEPTFALPALGLAMAADRVNVAEQHDRGLAIAWARQADLSPVDRAYLHAFAGPRYPEPSSAADALAAWEYVVRVAPDRAEGWHQLGESFYYDGEAVGMRDGPARAVQAFRHALALDPSFAPSRRMLTLVLARQGDTASLRKLIASGQGVDSADAMGVFVRWRAAYALGDWREAERLHSAFRDA